MEWIFDFKRSWQFQSLEHITKNLCWTRMELVYKNSPLLVHYWNEKHKNKIPSFKVWKNTKFLQTSFDKRISWSSLSFHINMQRMWWTQDQMLHSDLSWSRKQMSFWAIVKPEHTLFTTSNIIMTHFQYIRYKMCSMK